MAICGDRKSSSEIALLSEIAIPTLGVYMGIYHCKGALWKKEAIVGAPKQP
jgi:hypothetical protein